MSVLKSNFIFGTSLFVIWAVELPDRWENWFVSFSASKFYRLQEKKWIVM